MNEWINAFLHLGLLVYHILASYMLDAMAMIKVNKRVQTS